LPDGLIAAEKVHGSPLPGETLSYKVNTCPALQKLTPGLFGCRSCSPVMLALFQHQIVFKHDKPAGIHRRAFSKQARE
jgi:hypothetical protein